MNADLARQLDETLVRWMVAHRCLPPWAEKSRPSWEVAAERRLHQQLRGLMGAVLDELFEEIRRRGFDVSAGNRQQLITRHLVPLSERMGPTILPTSLESATHGRHAVENGLRQQGMSIRRSPLPRQAAEILAERVFEAGKETMARITTDVQDVVDTISGAAREGQPADELARRLRGHFDGLEEHRLRAIARTEINTAQGQGNHSTMVEYGVEYKQWLTALDDAVRSSHTPLHGVVMLTSEPYPNGLMHPGDRGGPISEWIQCRCRQRPYLPRRGEVIVLTPHYP